MDLPLLQPAMKDGTEMSQLIVLKYQVERCVAIQSDHVAQ